MKIAIKLHAITYMKKGCHHTFLGDSALTFILLILVGFLLNLNCSAVKGNKRQVIYFLLHNGDAL